MKSFILNFKNVNLKNFILFWKDYYDEGKYSDKDYLFHLKKDSQLTPEDVLFLLEWKNGGPLSKNKMTIYEVVKKNLDELNNFRKLRKIKGEDITKSIIWRMVRSGIIWRIFLMHIAKPDVFPMFDQHVYRTFIFLEKGEIIDKKFSEKDLKLYFDYSSFVEKVKEKTALNLRTIDQAFFAFGKFIKEYKRQIEKEFSN